MLKEKRARHAGESVPGMLRPFNYIAYCIHISAEKDRL